jgi:hypothetical protein
VDCDSGTGVQNVSEKGFSLRLFLLVGKNYLYQKSSKMLYGFNFEIIEMRFAYRGRGVHDQHVYSEKLVILLLF